MTLQRRLLLAMLWMLALAATAGVVAIFVSTQVMGRVAGTALVAAVAVGLAMPVSRMLDDEKRRQAGMAGLWAIVASFTLAEAAIWVDLLTFAWSIEDELAFSSVLVCISGLLATNLVGRQDSRRLRVAGPAGLAMLAMGTALLAAAIWSRYPAQIKLAETGWLVLGAGLVAALSLVGLGLDARPWRWLGVLASGAGLALGLMGVWVQPSDDPSIFIATMGAATVVAYANVVLSVPLGEARAWACLVSIGSVAATAGCFSTLSFITGGFDGSSPDSLVRVTGATGIVAACSTLGIVVLYRLNRRPPGISAAVSDIETLQLVCPHCGRNRVRR